ncbi:unnamed protein product [Rotaria sp. Silwood1]|nr:unnamed protein product [Rotaria sp. Silwood1]
MYDFSSPAIAFYDVQRKLLVGSYSSSLIASLDITLLDNIHLLSSSPSRTAAGAEVKKTKLEPKEPGAEEAEAVEPGAEEAEAVEPGAEEAEAVEPGAEEAEAEAVEPGAGGAATAAAALATAAAALAALAEVGAAAGAAAAPLMMAIIRCICGNEGVE